MRVRWFALRGPHPPISAALALFAPCLALHVLGACATTTGPPTDTYRKTEPPLTISWIYVRQPGLLVAEGVAHNDLPRKFQFVDVHATLTGIGRGGRAISRVTTRVPDFVGSETRFRITLTLTGSESTFELGFRYRVEDLEKDGRGG